MQIILLKKKIFKSEQFLDTFLIFPLDKKNLKKITLVKAPLQFKNEIYQIIFQNNLAKSEKYYFSYRLSSFAVKVSP